LIDVVVYSEGGAREEGECEREEEERITMEGE